MKVEQEENYKPITITLETREEAEALFDFVDNNYKYAIHGTLERGVAIDLSNQLSEKL